MKKLRILRILEATEGGILTHISTLDQELIRRGHKVYWVTQRKVNIKGIKNYVLPVAFESSLLYLLLQPDKNHSFYSFLQFNWNFLKGLLKKGKDSILPGIPGILFSTHKIKKIVEDNKIDVINTHLNNPTLVGYIASKLTNKPLFVNLHGIINYSELFPPLNSNKIKSEVVNVFSHAREYSDFVLKKGVKKSKLVNYSPFVDLTKFNSKGKKLPRKKNEFIILHSGRLAKDKYLSAIESIKAIPKIYSKNKNVRLMILGSGHKEAEVKALAEEVNRNIGKKAVNLLGFKNNPQDYYRSADVVIGIDRVAMEALASGSIVILAGQKEGPKGGSFGGVVSPKNIKSAFDNFFTGRTTKQKTNHKLISNSIIKILNLKKSERKKISISNETFIKDKCDVKKNASIVEKAYLDFFKTSKYFFS